MLRLRVILLGVLIMVAAALAAASSARPDRPASTKSSLTSCVPWAPSAAAVAAVPPMTGAGAPAATTVAVFRAAVALHQVTSPARVAHGLATTPSYLHTFNLLI